MTSVFPGIYDVIDKNPTKHTNIALHRDDPSTTVQGSETWDSFTMKPIQPPGPLSVMLWNSDPMYAMGTPALRKQLLTEKLLELHQRVDNELIGRRWPRKKIQDLLASQVSAGAPAASDLVEEVLCELFQIQKISISRKSRTIRFYPTDVRLWTNERPVLFGDDENCWFYEPTESISITTWLQDKETSGWTIQWPTADGKLEELKTAVEKRGVTPHTNAFSDSKKLKKEDFARILGRAESLSALLRLGLRTS